MAKKANSSDGLAWREFGDGVKSQSAAFERPVEELPPEKQNLRVQATRAGRKGKTVTVITGFQAKPETLQALLKHLKTQCGTGGALKDLEIEIQGEHKQKLLEILTKMGYKVKISGG